MEIVNPRSIYSPNYTDYYNSSQAATRQDNFNVHHANEVDAFSLRCLDVKQLGRLLGTQWDGDECLSQHSGYSPSAA